MGGQGSKEKKSGFEKFCATFEGVFFKFLWAKKNLKYFNIRIEKFHKMAFIIFCFFFEKVEKIGYHSNFNFECNTERGFKESLSIALGLKLVARYLRQ